MRYIIIIFFCLLLALMLFFIRKEIKTKKDNNSNLIKVPLFVGVFSLIGFLFLAITGLCLIIYVNINVALIMWSISLLPLFMLWWYFVYQIEICIDCFKVRTIFLHNKTFYFSKIFLYNGNACLIVQNQYGIEKMRISDFYTNTSKLEKAYSSFFKINRLNKPKRLSNKVTCANFVRNIGVFSLIFAFLIFLFTCVGLILMPPTNDEIICVLILMFLSMLFVLIGITILFYYFKWYIELTENELIINGFFKKKSFILQDITFCERIITIEIYDKNDVRQQRVFIYLTNNYQILRK